MTYKDILVYADAAPTAAVRLDAAAQLAKTQGAHLVALHVDAIPFTPVDLIGVGVTADLLKMQARMRKERVEAAHQLVQATEQRHGIAIEWRNVEDNIEDAVLRHGLYADLIVLSQGNSLTDLEAPAAPMVGSVAVAAGRPVLVVPKDYVGTGIGRRILVAWKPSAEAARAVHDALPLLQTAEAVIVMRVNSDPEEPVHNPGFDLANHLARHGVKVTVTPVRTPDAAAGDAITEQARILGAGLIVMGAYGHSRAREFVFGGATRSLLQAPPVPVLMSH